VTSPTGLAQLAEPGLLHHAPRGGVFGERNADNPLQT
jgi:hypothetical protein